MTVPRVSDILSLLYPGSLDYVGQEDLDRGSRLHESMKEWGLAVQAGKEPPPIYEECVPVANWLLEQQGMEIVACEVQYTHLGLNFTGRPDLIIRWNGWLWVVDYKFSESLSEQNKMQMEAYRQLIKANLDSPPMGLLLQCGKNGMVKAKKCPVDSHLLAAFLSGLNVFHFQHRGE